MNYTVKQLAVLAGVSVRTLHYYDSVGILKPSLVKDNGYRVYSEKELLLLQQIMFFRELDFSIKDIKNALFSSEFDLKKTLHEHKHLIELKKKRLENLLSTIDRTIKKINKETIMNDQELYSAFSSEEMKKYREEAKQRWGSTEAYKQSEVRVKKMGKDGLKKVMEEGNKISLLLSECMKDGLKVEDGKVQELIGKHYEWVSNFYDPSKEIYSGLADLYVEDERFKINYEKIAVGLAEYISSAMKLFAENMK